MSWSFEIHGKTKEALTKAATGQLLASVGHADESGKQQMEPVLAVVTAAIAAVRVTDLADCIRVKSSGHVDDKQCYFTVEVIPVYLPKLVDG